MVSHLLEEKTSYASKSPAPMRYLDCHILNFIRHDEWSMILTNVPMKSDERLQDRFELYSTSKDLKRWHLQLLDVARELFPST